MWNCCTTVVQRYGTVYQRQWLRARTRQRRSDRHPSTLRRCLKCCATVVQQWHIEARSKFAVNVSLDVTRRNGRKAQVFDGVAAHLHREVEIPGPGGVLPDEVGAGRSTSWVHVRHETHGQQELHNARSSISQAVGNGEGAPLCCTTVAQSCATVAHAGTLSNVCIVSLFIYSYSFITATGCVFQGPNEYQLPEMLGCYTVDSTKTAAPCYSIATSSYPPEHRLKVGLCTQQFLAYCLQQKFSKLCDGRRAQELMQRLPKYNMRSC